MRVSPERVTKLSTRNSKESIQKIIPTSTRWPSWPTWHRTHGSTTRCLHPCGHQKPRARARRKPLLDRCLVAASIACSVQRGQTCWGVFILLLLSGRKYFTKRPRLSIMGFGLFLDL
jgi:hypothetical protein